MQTLVNIIIVDCWRLSYPVVELFNKDITLSISISCILGTNIVVRLLLTYDNGSLVETIILDNVLPTFKK